jgi:hypothetical protein
MKLYTEEQVKKALNDCGEYFIVNMVLEKMKPIELPSDEEIREEGLLNFPNSEYVDRSNDRLAYYVGAKWIKEQILNQGK